jgi:lipopolysaccharide export system protein LptC
MERKLILTVLILAIVALATQALVWVFAPRDNGNEFVGPPRSDYTLTDFTLNALGDDGALSFTVSGPRLARKEDDGSIFVATPNYEIVDNSQNLWKGTSDSAWVNKDGTIMRLEGKVDMHRLATAKVDPVQLLTSDLTITTTPKDKKSTTPAPTEKRLQTDALTTITDPNRIAHGVGMKADLGLKTVELLSDVHWISLPTHHAIIQK